MKKREVSPEVIQAHLDITTLLNSIEPDNDATEVLRTLVESELTWPYFGHEKAETMDEAIWRVAKNLYADSPDGRCGAVKVYENGTVEYSLSSDATWLCPAALLDCALSGGGRPHWYTDDYLVDSDGIPRIVREFEEENWEH